MKQEINHPFYMMSDVAMASVDMLELEEIPIQGVKHD